MRTPDLPMMEPMRMWGMRRRRGYVLDCGVEGELRSSLFSVRIIRPKAYEWSAWVITVKRGELA